MITSQWVEAVDAGSSTALLTQFSILERKQTARVSRRDWITILTVPFAVSRRLKSSMTMKWNEMNVTASVSSSSTTDQGGHWPVSLSPLGVSPSTVVSCFCGRTEWPWHAVGWRMTPGTVAVWTSPRRRRTWSSSRAVLSPLAVWTAVDRSRHTHTHACTSRS